MILPVGARCVEHPGVAAAGVIVVEGREVPACQGCYQQAVRQARDELQALRDESGGDS